ncbi:MAG: Mandelate racemase/muconate lactonizing protein [Frankiales bacterium]|nr:Mandelate racemase/muconate lactonizing protein [Frankiales bacterium]
MPHIVSAVVTDLRFPTSRQLDGSDAMNSDPDYSAAYVVLQTDSGPDGHGFAFTIGRGNDVQAQAIRTAALNVVGRPVPMTAADLHEFSRCLLDDSQLRWLGPDKGVMHMGMGALINAAWDVAAKTAGLPLWQFLARMTPEEIVSVVDFRYLTDVLTPDDALVILRAALPGRAEREAALLADGYPAYTTSPGWLGYSDEKLAALSRAAIADGFRQIKLKVGGALADDVRRMRIARDVCGPDMRIAIDANQRWNVDEAIAAVNALREFDPWWVEEPTAPDDILAHAAIRRAVSPVRIATGEHAHNKMVFKQLLQAEAIDYVQIDACRVAGVNENIAILLLAAKFGVPVAPHAGGVGLCELVQHLAMFDFIAVSGSLEDRVVEYVDHLHEHFEHPVVVENGHYLAPTAPGFSAEIKAESLATYVYPTGDAWAGAPVTRST